MSQDRGYGTGPWLSRLSGLRVRFVVRRSRKATSCSTTPGASAKPGRSPGANAPGERRPNCCGRRMFASLAAPACSPCPCVIPSIKDACGWWSCERRKGREPWYLLTNEPVETEEQAWEIAFSYVSRWKIEEQFRFQKTELLIESLRLRDWEPRRKLLLLVTLAYGFLLWVLAPGLVLARSRLLVRLRATRRLAAVERQTSSLSAPLGAQSALALPSSLLCGVWLAAFSSPLPPHLAALFVTLVDDSVASDRISVLKLCFGSC
jgi:hypothetical protein